MAIGKRRGEGSTQADKDWAELNPTRIYNDAELRSFHQKIQRFYEDRTLTTGEVVRVFNYDEFAVAYGAFSKLVVGKVTYYRARANVNGETTRYGEMNNLMHQYDDWRQKNDWVAAKRAEDFEIMAPAMAV